MVHDSLGRRRVAAGRAIIPRETDAGVFVLADFKALQLQGHLAMRHSLDRKPTPRLIGQSIHGSIYEGDALTWMKLLPSSLADLIFLDPPFNLGKVYSPTYKDRRPRSEYYEWLSDVLSEAARLLKASGSLYLYHVPQWAMRFGTIAERFLNFQHWIAISMKNGFVRGRRLYPAHYSLLHFTKGPLRHFRRPRIQPARCRHCNKLVKDYGGYVHIIKERRGVNLSDIWDDLSPLRHQKYKNRKQNELPMELYRRIFSMSGVRGGLYVDPFAGGGGGVLAAMKSGMSFLACDLVSSNCVVIRRRVSHRMNEA